MKKRKKGGRGGGGERKKRKETKKIKEKANFDAEFHIYLFTHKQQTIISHQKSKPFC